MKNIQFVFPTACYSKQYQWEKMRRRKKDKGLIWCNRQSENGNGILFIVFIRKEARIISGSNIIELINFLLRNKTRKPTAFEEFKEILNKNNFPQEFIKNKNPSNVKMMYARPGKQRRKISSNVWLKM